MPRCVECGLLVLMGLALMVLLGQREAQAHDWVTSIYTYNEDIFPILREHCGSCHVEGGAAPMGLMKWNDGPNSARPWAESIRALVTDEQMPPWYVDPTGPAVRGGSGLSAMEAEKLLAWATGGTPPGDLEAQLPQVTYRTEWSGGPPDMEFPIQPAHTLAAETREETVEFTVSTGLNEPRWLRAVDLLPGAPAIVRNALIWLEGGPVLAVWVPGGDLVAAPSGAAYRLPPDANLHVEIHYKKQWSSEGQTIQDRSTVGLYFTDPPLSGREIQSVAIEAQEESLESLSGTLEANARVVAVRPSLDQIYGSFAVEAVTPTGGRVPLLRLRMPRPEWRRRYWLAEPVELPAGTRIEVNRTLVPSHVDLIGARLMQTYPLEVALDFVPLN
jgi:hypothetical protein